MMIDKDRYERDLKERQRRHLENVKTGGERWQPCLHDGCAECHGTGIRHDGSICAHAISCPCPRCSPSF